MDPAKIKAALEAIKNGDADAALKLLEEMIAGAAGGGEPPAEDALADGAEPPHGEEEQPAAQATALSRAVSVAEAAQAEVKALTERLSKIEKERASADNVERLSLIADLVKLGVELPATAWQGKPEDSQAGRAPCEGADRRAARPRRVAQEDRAEPRPRTPRRRSRRAQPRRASRGRQDQRPRR